MAGLYRVVEGPLDLREAIGAVSGPDRGALATFLGLARDHHAGRRVVGLEYHAYPEMVERVMKEIGLEVAERFGTSHTAILHRIGVLVVGETSVIVAVAAAHRREALAGCAHAIERLKALAPIWKKERYEGESAWIEGSEQVPPATAGPTGR
ncbi:MAG TPA: molybdenum cofactor biosynthesis protein MoaE [Candidatus Polarisedimenticolia bacterium]|nr:molybdenum cofactor biosynthesis protein MoaE [Candidatus Polarisedimenticolia bacterium]